ncbi:MAG: hypothetical protein RHS_2694 [Robinsoniella sp. RHS]|nr:MAG: hypothetical protein RHS_2694 [Robinsoniella sp. RHS]
MNSIIENISDIFLQIRYYIIFPIKSITFYETCVNAQPDK